MYKYILLLFLCLHFYLNTEAQTLAGDDCQTATVLTVDTTCTSLLFTNLGATNSSTTNPPCGAYAGSDVWFTCVVPASGKLHIRLTASIFIAFQVYLGDCNTMTSIHCKTGDGFYNIHDMSKAGQTIFIRVWRFNSAAGGNFNICVMEPNTPANDFCTNALSLPVLPALDFSTVYSNLGATSEPTSVVSNPICGSYTGNDVWFKAVMPASGHLGIGWNNISNMGVCAEILTGGCGSFTKINCTQLGNGVNINNPSLAGQTIYIRVWDFGGLYNGGNFNLSVYEPPTPINDFCAQAISLPVDTLCNLQNFTIIGCTAESTSVAPNPNCTGYTGNDIWFTIVMPASGHLRIERLGNQVGYTVYSGSCGAFTQLDCAILSGNFINIHNSALANQTIYLRAWIYGSSTATASFSICVTEPETPDNDFCANALPLLVNTNCVVNQFTIEGCTRESTSVAPDPSCIGFINSDVWFTFVMPANGLVTAAATTIGNMQPRMAIYSGSCGALTQLTCNSSLNIQYINLNNPSLAGQTLYLRVWDFNVPDGTLFGLCLQELSCLPGINSIDVTKSSCSVVSDASINVNAYCVGCTGALEYSLNNGPYQSSPTFSNITSGFHQVTLRDVANTSCITQSGIINVGSLQNASIFYPDLDNDGYGNSVGLILSCTSVSGYINQGGDCNDNNSLIYPGAVEIPCNGIDENCNGPNDDTPSEIEIRAFCNPVSDGDLVASNHGHDGSNFNTVLNNTSKTHQFTIQNTDNSILIINSIQISGTDANQFSLSGITTPTSIPANQSVTFDLHFTPTNSGAKHAIVTINNNDCDEYLFDFAVTGEGTATPLTILNLTSFLEGYYIGQSLMTTTLLNQGVVTCPDITDSVVVSLHDPITHLMVAENKSVVKTNGLGLFSFNNLASGNYYIAVKYRNGLETWSALPVSFTQGDTTSYNFSSASSLAYGANQNEIEQGVWGIYSGEIEKDGGIDALDYLILDQDIVVGNSGYLDTDLNGDGSVDALDYLILDQNIVNGIGAVLPN